MSQAPCWCTEISKRSLLLTRDIQIGLFMKFFPSSERLRRIEYKGKEVILVDYNGLKESEMIALTNRHRDLVVAEQKESYFIAYYENTYGTPAYMQAAYEFTKATKPYIPKGAFMGIRGPKVALLKGVIYFLGANFRSFDSEQDALDFLMP